MTRYHRAQHNIVKEETFIKKKKKRIFFNSTVYLTQEQNIRFIEYPIGVRNKIRFQVNPRIFREKF